MTRNDILKQLSEYLKQNKSISNIFGDFCIEKQLGEGGTSIVREASFNGEKYAIKFLLENIKDGESRAFKRFKQAYMNMMLAQHSSVILPQIHFDLLLVTDDLLIPYTIMPKADMTLKEWNGENDLSFDMFEKVFKDILTIVDRVHVSDIIHRDIKPENLFFFKKKLVLGDFDIAKFDDPAHIKLVDTKRGEKLANFAYSAPEQFSKDTVYGKITKQADWYAVGQVLFWLITGETLRGQLSIDLQKYDERYVKYEPVISKLLHQYPEERFGSKKEIEDYLQKQQKANNYLYWDDGLFEFEDNIIDKYTLGKNGFHQFGNKDDIDEIMEDLSQYNWFVLEKGNAYFSDVRLWWTQGGSNNAINGSIEKVEPDSLIWKIGYIEMNIKSIWVFKHYSGFGGSCLIIETNYMEPSGLYEYYDDSWDEEFALYGTVKISRNEFDSGWALIDGERVNVSNKTELRRRIFKPTLFFIAPLQTSIHDKKSDTTLMHIIKDYQLNYELNEKILNPLKSLQRREKVLMND